MGGRVRSTYEECAPLRAQLHERAAARRALWEARVPPVPEEGPITVVLVGCVAQKAAQRMAARDLYVSPLWRCRRGYAEREAPRRWLILSAAFGLVHPDEVLSPYNRTLADERKGEREAWGRRAAAGLRAYRYGPPARLRVEVHAGEAYRQFLVPRLGEMGMEVVEPLAGLGIGSQLEWYSQRTAAQLPLWESA